ncbi:fimbria/pilus periplasmic chaperone [Klebsiella aerogenes]|uniref:fimbria/pilus periplasmic chaperone n=1 Tax=Klebsiella aerogenes TaxID=548 RepID=UPI0019032989|nr:fimbria/pilus periplasmic chaperone [Klebsiella aerogenes]MBK0469659.1 fimbria/pilus periplasmic chaperone [Klebsiella aerogenes]
MKTEHKIPFLKSLLALALLSLTTLQAADAAVALDRTRVIFEGNQKSMSVNVRNDNTTLPYLAQSWVEDAEGHKIQSPLMALPPLQRIEPGAKSLVKIQLVPGAAAKLPQDRETLFYFNLREIPPKSNKVNVLQLALQTRVKMFYRPAALVQQGAGSETPWQEKLTLTRQGDRWQVNNPTPYYVTLVADGKTDMKPLMVAPKSSADLGVRAASLGSEPHLAYINDWGGRPVMTFSCTGGTCKVTSNTMK